ELSGNHPGALEHYVNAVLDATEPLQLPDKSRAVTQTEAEWKQIIEKYCAWVSFSVPLRDEDYGMAVEGIKRCTSFVKNENFITGKDPVDLNRDTLALEWREAFIRNQKNDADQQKELLTRALKDTMSVLKIRTYNGYIYHAKLLDLRSGKRTDVTLYPNTTTTLLIKPRDYFLICSSEVQFTKGLSGSTWRSPENIIPLPALTSSTLKKVTLKTKVRRK
ncbi:MAG: hypothetical protein GY846_02750, partial [Deltaproteobacteria bacterium]|nr:hypothetical protein [Deltaproteobacteria bacterium]